MLRRVSLGLAIALAALTAACSNPTAPTAKTVKRSADVAIPTDSASRIAVQGAGI